MPLMFVYFIINFVGQTYGTVWVLFTEDRFLWNTTMVGLSLAGYGLFHAGAQALLTGPATKWVGAQNAVLGGMVFEMTACLVLAWAFQGWLVFALLPVFALAGVGMPALQSLLSNAVDTDHQGRLQGVLGSLVSLSAVFGPLIFSGIYFVSRDAFNGAVWVVGAAIYLVCLPVVMRLKNAPSVT